jgi:hypothetical protein
MNWGNKLLFTFIVFASGMGYLVYRSMHVNFDLVEKDYYKSELRYQQVIDGTRMANQLSTELSFTEDSTGIVVLLPRQKTTNQVKGDIWFYCPYDATRDKRYPLELDKEGRQRIAKLSAGSYVVKTSWSSNGHNYFSENKLIVH